MLISQLAHKTGLTPHTIRFYEKEGLLDERYIQRGENNYRYYSEDIVERIMLIKFGQTAGFTLSEIKNLIGSSDAGELTPYEQVIILKQKMDEIEEKIAELEQVKALLMSKLAIIHREHNLAAH